MNHHPDLAVTDRNAIADADLGGYAPKHDNDHDHSHANGHPDGQHDGHRDGQHHDHGETIRRLKTTEGHLRGIQRMLEQDVYCIDVIRQIQAVQAALDKISVSILNQHLNTCVITAVRGENPQERERVLKEIAEVFETKTKI